MIAADTSEDRPSLGELPPRLLTAPPAPVLPAPTVPAAPAPTVPVETGPAVPAWCTPEGQQAWRDAVRAAPVTLPPRPAPERGTGLEFRPVTRSADRAPRPPAPPRRATPPRVKIAAGGTATIGGLLLAAGAGWLPVAYGLADGALLWLLLLALVAGAVAGAAELARRHPDTAGGARR